MAVFVVGFVLLLSMAAHSDAAFCVCNSAASESALQKNIDYACGAGADCSAISQNGACFNPNTVRDHCNYAVNSYYQRKGQAQGSCDFSGTATVTPNAPSSAGSGCVYQANPSTGGTTPTTGGTPPTVGGTPTPGMGGTTPTTPGGGGTTPNNPGMGGNTTPTTGGTIGGTPSTGGTGTTNPGVLPGSTMPPPGFGLGPTGSGFGTDTSASVKLLQSRLVSLFATLLISGFMFGRM